MGQKQRDLWDTTLQETIKMCLEFDGNVHHRSMIKLMSGSKNTITHSPVWLDCNHISIFLGKMQPLNSPADVAVDGADVGSVGGAGRIP